MLPNPTASAVGSYDVVVTNWAGAVTSSPARLTLVKLLSSPAEPAILQLSGVGNYRVDWQSTPTAASWTLWSNLSLPAVSQQQLSDPAASTQPARFYRVTPQ